MPNSVASRLSVRMLALTAAFVFTANCATAQAPAQAPTEASAPAPARSTLPAAPSSTAPSSAAPLTAEAIMARVAAHQDQAEAARRHYVYQQHARISSRKGHSVLCEEITETRITPSANGSSSTLLSLQGRLLHNHQYLTYSTLSNSRSGTQADSNPNHPANPQTNAHTENSHANTDSNTGIDRDLVEGLRSDLLGDPNRNSTEPADKASGDEPTQRDGIDTRLFPLTSANQSGYAFQLLGREQINGHSVFHVSFHPKPQPAHKQDPKKQDDDDGPEWKGEAYIDTTAFQPVLIRTTLAHNIPFAVRTLLGTSLPGLGFAITYAPQPAFQASSQPASQSTSQPDAPWFPATFGTEFRVHVLFFFSREIILSAVNHDFEQTHVTSTILGDPKPLALPDSH